MLGQFLIALLQNKCNDHYVQLLTFYVQFDQQAKWYIQKTTWQKKEEKYHTFESISVQLVNWR